MNMSKAVIIGFAVLLVLAKPAAAQQSTLPPQSKWTALCSDSSSRYFYPRLLQRFLDTDTTLTDDELVLLSHGYTLQPSYSPYAQGMSEDSLFRYINQGDYRKALEKGREFLRTDPVSLRANLAMAFDFYHLDNPVEREKYATRVVQLSRSILASGTGGSTDSAFVVISIDDEYTILNFLGFGVTGQSLISDTTGRPFDMMRTVARKDTSYKRIFYFDVSSPMESLARELRRK